VGLGKLGGELVHPKQFISLRNQAGARRSYLFVEDDSPYGLSL